jgi:hypothetical protein
MRPLAWTGVLGCALGVTLSAQLPSAGAVVDPSAFDYVRDIAPGRAALVVLPLDAAALAHSRGPYARFADVRVIDGQNRQMPYLLEEAREPLELPITFVAFTPSAVNRPPGDTHRRSTYMVTLPYPRLPDADLVVETSQRTFRREVQLSEQGTPDRPRNSQPAAVITNRVWQHSDDSVPAPPLLLPARNRDATLLTLTIDDGDNAALPLTSMRLRLPGWRIRFYRPADTRLRLLYGSDDAVAPEYDLALLRTKVMEESAEEISAAPEPRARRDSAAIVSPRVFWGFLIAAVLVLVALVARLATSSPSEGPSQSSGPGPSP